MIEERSLRSGREGIVINTAQFLPFLDPETNAAERKYRMLRSKLVFYFEVHGRNEAEDLADEVIVRVLQKIDQGAQIDASDVVGYCFGVAKHVLQEARKSRQEIPLEDVPGPEWPLLGRLNHVELAVLQQQILNHLSAENRDLLLRYHLEDRKALASDLGLTPNALRIRVYRLFEQLRQIANR